MSYLLELSQYGTLIYVIILRYLDLMHGPCLVPSPLLSTLDCCSISFLCPTHLTYLSGVDNPDYSLFPNKEFQVRWLKIYLEETAALKGEDPVIVSDTDVERLYTEVKTFLPVSSNLK